jgi:epoxyqueuosine reductase
MTSHTSDVPAVPVVPAASGRQPEPRPLKYLYDQAVDTLLGPFLSQLMRASRMKRMWMIPSLPRVFRASQLPPFEPWRAEIVEIPEALKTQPGIRKDPALEQEAFEQTPMPDFQRLHFRSVQWLLSHHWRALLPVAPRLIRAGRRIRAANGVPTADGRTGTVDPAALTREVKEFGLSLGLSAVGVTRWDDKYMYEEWRGTNVGDRVIVVIEEQGWDRTQAIPGHYAERGALTTYVELLARSAQVTEFLKQRGYNAQSHDLQGRGHVIPFAVEAGLGQLGLNGQLLTPYAGSRCRISLIDTDAPLDLDAPVDYGIEGVCDNCRVCVRRCPPGAITAQRKFHRGVYKAKIDTGRCFPVIAQTDACAICMKVCPVQRYGLNAVVEEWNETGRILGKDTDELEGYYWPPDGKYYPVGVRPKLSKEFLNPYPPGAELDLTRTKPLSDERDLFG